MATTKSRTTRRTTRSRTSTPRATSTTTPAKRDPSIAARTGKAIKKRPVASAAIGTGLVAGIAAAVAGFFAFKKSGKTFSEFSGDVADNVKTKASSAATKVKATAADAGEFVKDGLAEATTKAKEFTDRRKDGVDDKTQAELSEEALTLKTVSKRKTRTPKDPVVEEQTKVGANNY